MSCLTWFVAAAALMGACPAAASFTPTDLTQLSELPWSGSKSEYIMFRSLNGDLVGTLTKVQSGSARKLADLLIDQQRSSGTRLIGKMKIADGTMVDMDLALSGSGAGAMLYGYLDDGHFRRPVAYHHGDPGSIAIPASASLLNELAATVWSTPLGELSVWVDGWNHVGVIRDAHTRKDLFRLKPVVAAYADNDVISWSWEAIDPGASAGSNALLAMVLSPDRKTVLAGYMKNKDVDDRRMSEAASWRGARFGAAPAPAGQLPGDEIADAPSPPSQPSGQPGPGTQSPDGAQPLPATMPAGDGSFRALGKYSVRLDRVVAGKDGRAHVYLTLKNASQQKLYVTSGQLTLRVTDGNGVSKENGQLLQPLDNAVKLFDSTPVLDPGDELKVQYAVVVEAGSSTAKVRVSEGDKRIDF